MAADNRHVSGGAPYLRGLRLVPERVPGYDAYPFSIPALKDLDLTFDAAVTIFVGENGTGKSTLLEALAVLIGIPASGGGREEAADGRSSPGAALLARALRPSFAERPRDTWFLRAENMVRFADLLDERKADPNFWGDPYASYGGKTLHERSHGEAFLNVLANRLNTGLILLDEPETALSPQRQIALLTLIHRLVKRGPTQFLLATHAPILLTIPGATLLSFDHVPPRRVSLAETSHYRITRGVLEDPARWWRSITEEPGGAEGHVT